MRWELADKLKDRAFVESFKRPDRTKHPELLLADYFELVGACMKYGLMQKASFIDATAGPIISAYREMQPVITIMRQSDSQLRKLRILGDRVQVVGRPARVGNLSKEISALLALPET